MVGVQLCGFSHPTALNAIRADQNPLDPSIHHSANALEVRKKTPWGPVMRVTHIVARHRFLTADFTYSRHCYSPK